MKTFRISQSNVRNGILYLTISPESATNRLSFTAGQYVSLRFRRKRGYSVVRSFSIASTPHDDTLSFAIRLGRRFTRSLVHLPLGTVIEVDGPFGDFTLNRHEPAVMLAGGIGITPIMSIIRTAALEQNTKPIILLYSCRSRVDIPFYKELRTIAEQHANIRVYFFIGNLQEARQDALHFSGRISEQHLAQCAEQYRNRGGQFYLCGPVPFSKSIAKYLAQTGVYDEDVHSESFAQTNRVVFGGRWSAAKLTYALSGATFAIGAFIIGSIDLSHTTLAKDTATNSASLRASEHTDRDADDVPRSSAASTATDTATDTASGATQSQNTSIQQTPVSSVS